MPHPLDDCAKSERDVGFWEQTSVIQQFLRRNRTRTFFFNLRRTRSTQSQLEIRGSQVQPITPSFHQNVGQDRNRRLLLHNPLQKAQLTNLEREQVVVDARSIMLNLDEECRA